MTNLANLKNDILTVTNTSQSIRVKRKNWKKFNLSQNIENSIFGSNEEISIERNELKNDFDTELKVLKIIMWGYPKGGFPAVPLRQMVSKQFISRVASLMNQYKGKDLNKTQFFSLKKELDSIKHLGVSTYTKLLYFFGVKVEGDTCLIYDRNVIAFLNSGTISECTISGMKWTRTKGYLEYIKLVNKLGKDIGIPSDQLEMYFFEEGKKF